MLKFAKEFYHPENNPDNQTPILIMSPLEPSNEMKSLLKSPFFQNKVFYIVGNPLKEQDLKLAKLDDNVVIILQNQFTSNFQHDDVFSVLATQLLKEVYPKCKIYAQIALYENAQWNFWIGWEKVDPFTKARGRVNYHAYKQTSFPPSLLLSPILTRISNASLSVSAVLPDPAGEVGDRLPQQLHSGHVDPDHEHADDLHGR